MVAVFVPFPAIPNVRQPVEHLTTADGLSDGDDLIRRAGADWEEDGGYAGGG